MAWSSKGGSVLLLGSRAVGMKTRSDTAWDLWVEDGELSITDPLVRGRCVIDQGDRCATVYAQGREYRLRWIPAGDPRLAVMACNRDAALLDNGLGWNIRVASPETLVLVKRALLIST